MSKYYISLPSKLITSIDEVDLNLLKPHEMVEEIHLNSFINYFKRLEGEIVIPSIIVCNKTMTIIDGHHRYHALKLLGTKKIPVTFINYNSKLIKAFYDDRILKKQVINFVKEEKLFAPKTTKHVVFDSKSKEYKPIILLSSIWYLKTEKKIEFIFK